MKNLRTILNEFNDRRVNMTSLPACCYIESVKGCPCSCAMCQSRGRKPQFISEELLKKIEPCFHQLDVLAIHGDGEPLLGNIGYFVDMSMEHDFVLHMNTTGLFLTRRIADLLSQARLSIRFSIHAGTPATYGRIMGNDFTQVINNIDYLVRKDRDTNKHSDFWFSFIVMKENLGEITEFLKIAHASGIRHVRFMELAPSKESIRGVTMPNRDFRFNYFTQYNPAVQREFLEKLPFIRKLAQELDVGIETGSMAMSQKTTCRVQKLANTAARKMSLKTSLFPLKRRKGMCVAPWLGQLVISQGGDVRLCCKSRYSLGNINNSSLEEIWNCEFVKKVRTSFKTETFPRICEYCRGIEFDEYPRNSGIYNSMTPLARPVDNERPKDVL